MAKAILYPTIGLLWEAELMDPELSRRLLPRVQPVDRRLLSRLRGPADSDRAPLAGRSGRGGAGARARGARRLPRGLRVPVHDHARAARRRRARRGLRGRAGSGRAARDPPDVRAARLERAPSLRQVRLGGVVLRPLRRPRRAAGLRHLLPARRLRPLPAPARGGPRIAGRLDRLLPGPRRRHLRRDHARRHRPAQGASRRTTSSASATSRPIRTSARSPP